MNIIILGPPASGKGTYSDYIESKYNFVHISMGDLLRQTLAKGSKYNDLIKSAIDNGQILDEYIAGQILRDYLTENDYLDNILLDGHPRGIISAHLLEQYFNVDVVIKLDLSAEKIKQRVLNRLRCSKCGKNFSKLTYSKNTCDQCGAELEQRTDDTLETLEKRLKVYKDSTIPVLDYYEQSNKVFTIDADCSIEEGYNLVDKLMKSLQK